MYDLIHQVLTGRIDAGYNRELTISLFRDARIIHRIIEGSKRNDIERLAPAPTSRTDSKLNTPPRSSKPKGVRLGYMGHLTLISEDVIGALEHFPPDLRLIVAQYAPQPEWDEYVSGRYKETKKKDSSLLGGGKPVVAQSMRAGAASWKVDEADAGTAGTAMPRDVSEGEGDAEGMHGEFRRNVRTREGSADFSAGAMDEDDDEFHAGPPHVSVRKKFPCTYSFLNIVLFYSNLVCALPRAGDAVWCALERWRYVGRRRRRERVAYRALDVRPPSTARTGPTRLHPETAECLWFRCTSSCPLHISLYSLLFYILTPPYRIPSTLAPHPTQAVHSQTPSTT